MGKIRQKRFKTHETAVSCADKYDAGPISTLPEIQLEATSGQTNDENIFGDVTIDLAQLFASRLTPTADSSSRSVISKKEIRRTEQRLSKVEKRRLRRERFIQKLDLAHRTIAKKRKKKKSKVMSHSGHHATDGPPPLPATQKKNSTKNKLAQVENEIFEERQNFRALLQNMSTLENPGGAVRDLLRQRLAAQIDSLNS